MTEPLEAARVALAGQAAWLVGGAVRDALLGRPTADFDVAVAGDPETAARAIARAARGTAFELSGAFGAWRVVGHQRSGDERSARGRSGDERSARGGGWNVDLVSLREGDLVADLAARDFTINAMAEPLAGGELLDLHGGRADLEARRLRMVSAAALADDPLRTLRAARLAVELGLELDPETREEVRRQAPGLAGVAPERVFAELKRVVCAERPADGLLLAEDLGVVAVVLPELAALRGVEQNVFHHRDVHGHTLEVLEAVASLEVDAEPLGEHAAAVRALLAEPLGDDMTRGDAMRFAALLHDAAKPATRDYRADGRVTFIGHDSEGAELARGVMRRLRASQRVADYVAALTLHHLRLGFLVHDRPLSPRGVWRYLAATDPNAADVTIFTVADRLATRGRNAEPAIAAHLELARQVLGPALDRRVERRRAPLVRGDELAAVLGIEPGPQLGALLAALEEARYAGEIASREEAISLARSLLT